MFKKFAAALAAACLLTVGLVGSTSASAAEPEISLMAAGGNGQETCPNTGDGWVKYDGLSGTTFTVPEKGEGWSIDQVCYKSSTTVVYLDGQWVITSTVTNQNGNVQALSHVSVHYVYTPKPEDEITYGDWSGEWECADTTVLETRAVYTVTYTWDLATHTWVASEPVQTGTEERTRDLTPQERVEGCIFTPVAFDVPVVAPTCDAAAHFETLFIDREGYNLTIEATGNPNEYLITATADEGFAFEGEGDPFVRTTTVTLDGPLTGEICTPDIGGRTIGFWTNKNGTAAQSAGNLWAKVVAEYPVQTGGLTFSQAQTFIKNATSSGDGSTMLRAQFFATALNVQYIGGYGAQHFVVPTTSAILPGETVTVVEYLNAIEANWASLDTKAERVSVTAVLDAINQDVASDLFV